MPISDRMEFPVREQPVSGQGVELLKRRMEDNDHPQIEAAELIASFNRIRTALFDGLKAIVASRL